MKSTARRLTPDRGRESRSPASAQNRSNPTTLICCEVLQGVKSFACKELLHRFGKSISILPNDDPETIFLPYQDDLHELLRLRTNVSVYLSQHLPVPPPPPLLRPPHFHTPLRPTLPYTPLHPPHP